MPIYEYQCDKCNCLFERKQRYDEEPAAVCQCGGKARRVLRSVPIIFKGSGFYVTDHKGSTLLDGDTKPKDTPKEAVAAEAKSSTPPAVKPAATPEAKTDPRAN